jgi:hypothetical protein
MIFPNVFFGRPSKGKGGLILGFWHFFCSIWDKINRINSPNTLVLQHNLNFNFLKPRYMRKISLMVVMIAMLGVAGNNAQAQDVSGTYKHAIGGRFGVANGITYKHFLNDAHAIDGIINFQGNREFGLFKLIGLYTVHQPIGFLDYEGLTWYYGAGGGIGSYNYKSKWLVNPDGSRTEIENDRGLAWSFDGVVGIDSKIPTAPINLSLDWKPTMELTPESGVRFDGIGLSIRFVLPNKLSVKP